MRLFGMKQPPFGGLPHAEQNEALPGFVVVLPLLSRQFGAHLHRLGCPTSSTDDFGSSFGLIVTAAPGRVADGARGVPPGLPLLPGAPGVWLPLRALDRDLHWFRDFLFAISARWYLCNR